MSLIAVDLGTTNIKVASFDNNLNVNSLRTHKVDYERSSERVEFDAEKYYKIVAKTIRECANVIPDKDRSHSIILTGQAESLVAIDRDGIPLRNAISWLDERSKQECVELQQEFNDEVVFSVTGQVSIIPTWPITKMLWIRKHEPSVFSQIYKYMLLKDYIQYKMTGKILGEYSIYNFSLYFDIRKKAYWKEILDYVQVDVSQLPDLVEPCTNIGRIIPQAAAEFGLSADTTVNVGTLDHFAGMIGTGNISEGVVSESTGTVLSVATLIDVNSASVPIGIPCHYGPFNDSYVLLSVCESGGISLQWYKDTFLKNLDFDDLEEMIQTRSRPSEVIFLPYLTGINAPDYDRNAKGVFYGLRIQHDEFDLAIAVMEGVAHMLANNIQLLRDLGYEINKIISTGGGSRSDTWSQIKAEITSCDIVVPANEEVVCLGAAIIGAVDEGFFASFEEAVEKTLTISKQFKSKPSNAYVRNHEQFNRLRCLLKEFRKIYI